MTISFEDFCCEFFRVFFQTVDVNLDTQHAICTSNDVCDALLNQYKSISVRARFISLAESITNPYMPIGVQMRRNFEALPHHEEVADAITPFCTDMEAEDVMEEVHIVLASIENGLGETRHDEVVSLILEFLKENSFFSFSTPTLIMMFDEYLLDETFSTNLADIVVCNSSRIGYEVVYAAIKQLCKQDADLDSFFASIPEFLIASHI